MNMIKQVQHVVGAAAAMLCISVASAQDAWPAKPVTLLVPHPAGGLGCACIASSTIRSARRSARP